MRFYLGAPKACWLARTDVPLFVSRNVLRGMRKLPRALGPWALDSGGFTELQRHGQWTISAIDYAAEVRRFRDEIGNMAWAAPQDWMCEPIVLKGGELAGGIRFAGTGLDVRAHQIRTVANLVQLRHIAPDLPFVPVLQGWTLDDYLHCWDLYEMAGVHLQDEPIVGIGSVCRRQATSEAVAIFEELARCGLRGRMHGFGVKTAGLPAVFDVLASSDSQARALHARRRGILLPGHDQPGPGRPRGHKNCANCLEYLLAERASMLSKVEARRPAQRSLWAL